jgi:Protein of unknown function (DUF3108).
MMKKILLAFAALLLSAALCGARKLPSEAMGTLTYDVRYTWGIIDAKVATATFSLEPSRWQEQSAYHFFTKITTSSIFRLFIRTDITADLYIAQSDLQPLYFLNPTPRGKFEVRYDADDKKVNVTVLDSEKGDAQKSYPQDNHTMDLLALLSFVRFQDNLDKPIPVTVLMDKYASPAVLTYQGKDKEKFPGMEAERFQLRFTGRGIMENGSGKELRFWRSPDKGHQILGLEADLSQGFMSVRMQEAH